MFIKQYTGVPERVPDPLRPNRTVQLKKLIPAGAHSLSHDGKHYAADANGWFEVSQEVGESLCKFRTAGGGGYFVPGAVQDDPQGQPAPKAPVAPARAFKPIAKAEVSPST